MNDTFTYMNSLCSLVNYQPGQKLAIWKYFHQRTSALSDMIQILANIEQWIHKIKVSLVAKAKYHRISVIKCQFFIFFILYINNLLIFFIFFIGFGSRKIWSPHPISVVNVSWQSMEAYSFIAHYAFKICFGLRN